jgi:hypothetical protein
MLTNNRRMLYREIKSSSQRSGGRSTGRLNSVEPHFSINGTNADNGKSKGFGFGAKYGRDHVSIMSAESQEALKDAEMGQMGQMGQHPASGGIMKTDEFSVRQERMAGYGDDESIELSSMPQARSKT